MTPIAADERLAVAGAVASRRPTGAVRKARGKLAAGAALDARFRRAAAAFVMPCALCSWLQRAPSLLNIMLQSSARHGRSPRSWLNLQARRLPLSYVLCVHLPIVTEELASARIREIASSTLVLKAALDCTAQCGQPPPLTGVTQLPSTATMPLSTSRVSASGSFACCRRRLRSCARFSCALRRSASANLQKQC